MDSSTRVRLVASLYCDFLNQYLYLEEDLHDPQTTAELNTRCNAMQELKRNWIDPLENMLHRLGVSAVKEEGDLIKVKYDDGTACGWKKGWF